MNTRLPQFAFDAEPRSERCDRCGAGAESDLRFMILRGRTRYEGRTVCDTCAEVLWETLIAALPRTDTPLGP